MKWILVILCVCLSFSCTRKETWSVCLYKSVINKTDKILYYEVETDGGSKNEFVNASDSINMRFYREYEAESVFLGSTIRQNRIQVECEMVFNLTDTSKYEYSLQYETIPQQGENEEDRIFARHLVWDRGEGSTDKNVVITIKLSVTDSIIDIMQKDYSMLEKFKEYYSKNN